MRLQATTATMVPRGLAVVLLVAAMAGQARAGTGCPEYGCDGLASFSASASLPAGSTAPSLRWTVASKAASIQCVSGASIAVCSETRPATDGLLRGFNTSGAAWHGNTTLDTRAYPIMGLQDESVAVASQELVLTDAQGVLGGPVITLHPPLGPTFGPALTDNDVFVIASWESDFAAYLTNGVPHASLELQATIDGVAGLFTAVSHPVISANRAFVVTTFRDAAGMATGHCRLYALDVHRTMDHRFTIGWFLPVPCATRPSEYVRLPVVLLDGGVVLLVGASNATKSDVLAVRDTGTNATLLWTTALPGTVYSFAVTGGEVLVAGTTNQVARLQASSGKPSGPPIDLSPAGKAVASARMLVVQDSGSNAPAVLLVIPVAKDGRNGSGELYLAAFDVAGSSPPTLRWSVHLGALASPLPAISQVTVVDTDGAGANGLAKGNGSPLFVLAMDGSAYGVM